MMDGSFHSETLDFDAKVCCLMTAANDLIGYSTDLPWMPWAAATDIMCNFEVTSGRARLAPSAPVSAANASPTTSGSKRDCGGGAEVTVAAKQSRS